jgi:hypothetical protein
MMAQILDTETFLGLALETRPGVSVPTLNIMWERIQLADFGVAVEFSGSGVNRARHTSPMIFDKVRICNIYWIVRTPFTYGPEPDPNFDYFRSRFFTGLSEEILAKLRGIRDQVFKEGMA